jgi:hypothetical protein
MKKTSEHLEEIFATELEHLHTSSKNRKLSLEEVKKLETLTRAWKTFNTTKAEPIDESQGESELTTQELLSLARMQDEG